MSMSKPSHDELLYELPSLLFEMRQRIRERLPEERSHDPNAWLRMEALCMIRSREQPTMREFADYLHVRASSATSLISYLSKKGLVQRFKGHGDKRVVCLRLTAAGEQSVAKYEVVACDLMRQTFGRLKGEELLHFVRVLRRLNERPDPANT